MQTIITVEYGDVEEAVRCIRWAAGKTRLALAKHWSSCLIAGLGIVGFLGSLADTDRAQVFCVLMGFGFIGLLLQAIRRRLKYSDEMLKRILQIQGIRLILYEKGILSDTGKRSWRGIKLLVGKETVALMSSVQVYLAIPKAELTDEQLAQIRGWIQAAKKLRQEEERREDQEYICWGEDVFPRVYPFGDSGPCAVLFTGLGIDCSGSISQYVGYGLACTDGRFSGNNTS